MDRHIHSDKADALTGRSRRTPALAVLRVGAVDEPRVTAHPDHMSLGGSFLWRSVVVIALFALASCSGESSRSADRSVRTSPTADASADASYALPTDGWKPGDGAFDARSGGVFHAWRTAAGACAGWGHRRLTALWPAGYRVAFSPTRLLDPAGHVVAYEGDWITVGGGLSKAPRSTPCLNGHTETFGVMSGVSVGR